ncbi:MAG: redoxin domain-containing protein, partial [Planctomycetota bacterium]
SDPPSGGWSAETACKARMALFFWLEQKESYLMARVLRTRHLVSLFIPLVGCLPTLLAAKEPPVAEALKLKPVQEEWVSYDIPDAAEREECELKPYQADGVSGWEVRDADNTILRRYLDTNADNKVDQWCYFKNGVEVYRDIDTNHNRNADQYRWLGTAGTRWGVDDDEDGQIDHWKTISPEEVTEEAVLAMSLKDADRFRLLLLSSQELDALGLGEDQTARLTEKLAATRQNYEEYLKTQDVVGRDTQWVNFGGKRPGVVPAGTDGAQQDLHIYENVAAVINDGDQHDQVIIGTLVRVDDLWRVIDLPKSFSEAQAGTGSDGFFFQASSARRASEQVPVTEGLDEKVQDLISKMEQIDQVLQTAATPEELAPLHARRADLLEQLAETASGEEDQTTWIRQLADTVSAAAQSGEYPEGVERLAGLYEELQGQSATADLAAYVKYRHLMAEYTVNVQQPDADFAQIQQQWLANLKSFVDEYPTHPQASEAMLHLAMAQEFSGNEEKAVSWYSRIVEEFPASNVAEQASGAKRRIEAVGNPLVLSGKDRDGNVVNVESYRGRAVLVHYWATYDPKCRTGLSVLKDMQAKYGKDNLALIGVNVDGERAKFEAYLEENSLPWPQLHAPGGLDSPLAQAYGVVVLPTILLADQEGKVVNRDLDVEQVDSELRRLLR